MLSLMCAVLRAGGAGYVAPHARGYEADDRSRFGAPLFDRCGRSRGS
jgi:hypothetical protein